MTTIYNIVPENVDSASTSSEQLPIESTLRSITFKNLCFDNLLLRLIPNLLNFELKVLLDAVRDPELVDVSFLSIIFGKCSYKWHATLFSLDLCSVCTSGICGTVNSCSLRFDNLFDRFWWKQSVKFLTSLLMISVMSLVLRLNILCSNERWRKFSLGSALFETQNLSDVWPILVFKRFLLATVWILSSLSSSNGSVLDREYWSMDSMRSVLIGVGVIGNFVVGFIWSDDRCLADTGLSVTVWVCRGFCSRSGSSLNLE